MIELLALPYLQSNDRERRRQEIQVTYTSIGIAIVMSLFAFYLSWTCNRRRGFDHVMSFVYASFAFLFGTLYIFFYAIFTTGYCFLPSPTTVAMAAA